MATRTAFQFSLQRLLVATTLFAIGAAIYSVFYRADGRPKNPALWMSQLVINPSIGAFLAGAILALVPVRFATRSPRWLRFASGSFCFIAAGTVFFSIALRPPRSEDYGGLTLMLFGLPLMASFILLGLAVIMEPMRNIYVFAFVEVVLTIWLVELLWIAYS